MRWPTGRCSMPCSTRRAARRGCRFTTAAASASVIRSMPASSSSATGPRRRRGASSACSGTIRRRASCGMRTPATRSRSTARANRDSTCRSCDLTLRTLWRHAAVATCDDAGSIYANGAVVSSDGDHRVGRRRGALPAGLRPDRTVELAGRWLTPGLIDCHTHLVFAGQRAAEFARRTAGTSYDGDRARRRRNPEHGARHARRVRRCTGAGERTAAALAAGGRRHDGRDQVGLWPRLRHRTPHAARRPRARAAAARHASSTSLLAAHAVPPEYAGRADAYIDLVCNDWLPRFAEWKPARWPGDTRRPGGCVLRGHRVHGRASATSCSPAAAQLGWRGAPACRADREHRRSQVAARHRALACDHLEYTTEADVAALAQAAPSRCCCRSRGTSSPTRSGRRSSTCAQSRRADRRCERCQSRLGAGRFAAGRDEHGAPAVRADQRRGAARRDAPCRACARPARPVRRSRPGSRRTSPCGPSRHWTNWATGSASIPAAWSCATASSCSSGPTCET